LSSPRWNLTVRVGSKVDHQHFATLDEALAALEERAGQLTGEVARSEVRFFRRRIEPVEQVAARLEVAGPGGFRPSVHGGLDVRGDGSAEAYTGRVRRSLIEPRRGESPAAALRRRLGATT
jgi:hypothetical protein